MQRLVGDEDVARVAHDALAHHFLPGADEAMLVERCLQSLFTKKTVDDIAKRFGVGFSHDSECDLAALHLKDLVAATRLLKDSVQIFTVGVGDEDLSKRILGNKCYEL